MKNCSANKNNHNINRSKKANSAGKHLFQSPHPVLLTVFLAILVLGLTIASTPVYAEQQILDIVSIDDITITPNQTGNSTGLFNDMSGHWAAANIQTLVQKGAISGYPDGSFKPNKTITRAEFATVLVKALNLNMQSGKTFADTQNHWAKDYISTAYNQGIVKGMNDTQFAPDTEISREQMAVMIVNARKLSNRQSLLNFVDKSSISTWAFPAVATAVENKIFSGYPDNTFRPQGHATRAEAVTAIIKVM